MTSTRISISVGMLTVLFLGQLFAQEAAVEAKSELSEAMERLKTDLSFLASDELKGRDVGSEGIAEAGEYIAARFDDLGLQTDSFDGTPYQEFSIPGPAGLGDPARNTLAFEGVELELAPELSANFTAVTLGSNGKFSGELVFAGYGITAPELGYDDYEGIDVEGKVVVVLRKEPQQDQPDSIFDGTESSQYAYFVTKEMNAAAHNAAAMIMVNDFKTAGASDQLLDATAAGQGSPQTIPTVYCTRDLIDPVIKEATGKTLAELEAEIDQDVKPRSQVLSGITVTGETLIEQTKIPVRNVVGVLPGSGALASEFVVIGAHYDHVGMGGRGSLAPGTIEIHNGADDNASGTCTMMEVARRLSQQQVESRRAIIFMAFTGEERGLLGSKHYARNPRFPLEDTVAMLNMDMVGRLRNNEITIYGTGTAQNFAELIETMNETAQFELKTQAAGFGPSDHSSFYEKEIPVYHFFTGLHNQYHRPSDDIETVNFEGMARIASFITATATEIATAPERPVYNRVTSYADVGRSGPRNRRPRAVMGIQLDLNSDADGARVDSVPEDGPAAKAGLMAGDILVQVGDKEVNSIRDLRRVMSSYKPDDKVLVKVLRGEEELEIEMTLGQG